MPMVGNLANQEGQEGQGFVLAILDSLEKGKISTIQKCQNKTSMLPRKRGRPLDSKSIALYAKSLVIKGNTMTLKMEMSTFLT